MAKTKVAVIFGGRSVEHEVSVVTAHQILANADREKYEIVPVYITKSGRFLTGKALWRLENFQNLISLEEKLNQEMFVNQGLIPVSGLIRRPQTVDIVFPTIHGTFGEDGTLQGLLEMAQIPYVGSGVTASALGMDKILQKDIFRAHNLPVVDYLWFTRQQYTKNKQKIINEIKEKIKYPVFVKPANLGSSIAISKANNQEELENAIVLAIQFDRRVIIEQGIENIIEINCSVMGYNDLEVSVCEQPLKSRDMLTYEDKYLKGSKTKGMASLSRLIPAPISPALTKKIQEMAKEVFRLCDCAGLARIDFMVDPKSEKIWICEINTLPGSLSFYLWEKSGYSFPKLIDKLINLASERFQDRSQTNYSFSSNLLQKLHTS